MLLLQYCSQDKSGSMIRNLSWLSIQQKVYSLLPYGVLCFLFVMFASPNSKLANQFFYLLVLLPGLMSLGLVIKNRQAYTALWPIVVLVFFWATFSLVQLDLAGWDNVAKRFRHALYVAVFFTSSYCLLSANLISSRLIFAIGISPIVRNVDR